MQTRIAITLLFALCGCGEPPGSTINCTADTSKIDIQFTSSDQVPQIDKALHVRGTAQHLAGLAIRTLNVAGVAATSDDFNFAHWSATIPVDVLTTLPVDAGKVSLSAVATDACDHPTTGMRQIMVAVAGIPGTVSDLTLTPTYPASLTFIPANGAGPAAIQIIANGGDPAAANRAAHATLSLSTTGGSFLGLPDNTVTLDANGKATVYFVSTMPGVQTVTVTASNNKAQSTQIKVAAPPDLSPASFYVPAGQAFPVRVSSLGDLATCQSGAASALSISAGTQDLSANPSVKGLAMNGKLDLTVQASANAMSGAKVTLICADSYGQQGLGTYTVK